MVKIGSDEGQLILRLLNTCRNSISDMLKFNFYVFMELYANTKESSNLDKKGLFPLVLGCWTNINACYI